MKFIYYPVFLLLLAFSAHSFANSAENSSSDVLEQMFGWWNGIINTDKELKVEDFSRYFSEDAAIVLNGNEGVKGVANLPEYFEVIRDNTEYVEIVLPFKQKFQSGDKIFTYHTIRSTRKGIKQVSHNMGYALIKDGKIAYISLARFSKD